MKRSKRKKLCLAPRYDEAPVQSSQDNPEPYILPNPSSQPSQEAPNTSSTYDRYPQPESDPFTSQVTCSKSCLSPSKIRVWIPEQTEPKPKCKPSKIPVRTLEQTRSKTLAFPKKVTFPFHRSPRQPKLNPKFKI